MTETSPPTPQSTPSNYWGFWGTIGFGFLAFIVFGILQSVILIGYAITAGKIRIEDLSDNEVALKKGIEDLAYNGDLISLAEIPSALVGVGLIMLFITLKKRISIAQYLGLILPQYPIKTLFKWIGIMLLVFVLMEFATQLLEHETPEFMTKVYSSANNKVMLWIAVAVAAPIFEEFLFRGFLLEGLRRTFVGLVGAILLTSASWAIIHMQYGWFEIVTIFIIGIIFSVAKLKTQSLYVPIAMHMFMNLVASIMMEFAPAT